MAWSPAPFPRMPYLQLSLPCTEALQPRVERALEDVGALAVTLLDADAERNDASAPEGSDGTASGDATTSPAERVAALRSRVEAWQASFEGRQFLLPPYKAAPLMRSRNDYLAGTR